MSKLLKLKEWLTVGDTAKHLSISTGEEVTEPDILRLALDGHLTLSVNFINHARGRPARIEPLGVQHLTFGEFDKAIPLADQFLTGDLLPNREEVLTYEGEEQNPDIVEGVWNLLMLGAERLDVEHAYQNITGGPSVELICLDGPFVSNEDGSKVFQILDYFQIPIRPHKHSEYISELKKTHPKLDFFDRLLTAIDQDVQTLFKKDKGLDPNYKTVYYPAAGLPNDSVFVVRTSALRAFEKKLLDEDNQQETTDCDRPSYALVIAALLELLKEPIERPRGKRNQAAIKSIIEDKYNHVRGLSKRNLDNIFAAANKAMKEAKDAK